MASPSPKPSLQPVAWLISDGTVDDTPVTEDGLVVGRDHLRGWAQMRLLGYRSMPYMELPHMRIADLHCILLVRPEDEKAPSATRQVELCSLSELGVWVNEDMLSKGQVALLRDGDWICLAHVDGETGEMDPGGVEFQFRLGLKSAQSAAPTSADACLAAPPAAARDAAGGGASSASAPGTPYSAGASTDMAMSVAGGGPGSPFAQSQVDPGRAARGLRLLPRSRTENLQGAWDAGDGGPPCCPLCGGLLDAAVQIQPCSHVFCSTCLSNHLGSQLQLAIPLSCPIGCARPLRIVTATKHRQRVDEYILNVSFTPQRRHTAEPAPVAAAAAIAGAPALTATLAGRPSSQPGAAAAAAALAAPPAAPSSLMSELSAPPPALSAAFEASVDPETSMMEMILRWAYEYAIQTSPLPEDSESDGDGECEESAASVSTPRQASAYRQDSTATAARDRSVSARAPSGSSGATLSPPRLPTDVVGVRGMELEPLSRDGSATEDRSLELPRRMWPTTVRVPTSALSGGTTAGGGDAAAARRAYVDSPVFTSSGGGGAATPPAASRLMAAALLASPASSADSEYTPSGVAPHWWPGSRHSARYTSTGSPSPRRGSATYRHGSSPHFAEMLFSNCLSGEEQGGSARALGDNHNHSYEASLPGDDLVVEQAGSATSQARPEVAAQDARAAPMSPLAASRALLARHLADSAAIGARAALVPRYTPSQSPALPSTPPGLFSGTSFTAPTTLPSPLLERLSLQARQAPDSHTSGTTQDPLLCTPPRRTQGPVQGWARLGQGVDSPSHPDFCPTVALSASTHATNTATRVTPAMSPARQHGGPLALASMAVAQMSPQVLAGVRPPMPRYRRRSIAASDIGSPLRTVDGSPVAAAAAALGETPSPRTVSPVAAARRQPPAAVRVLAELAQHMPSSATRATPTVSSMSHSPQASRSGLACSSTNNANNTYPTDVHSPVGRRPTVACSVYTPDHSVAPAQRCTSLHCTRDAPCALCALGLSSPGGEDDNNGAQYSTVRLQAHSAQGPAVARMPSAATTIAWPSALSDDAGGAGDVLHPLDAAALAALSPPPLEPLERATSGVSLQRRWLSRFRAAGQRSPGDAVAPASGAPAAPEAPPGFQRPRSGLSGPRHGVDESAQDEDGGVVFFKSPGTMHVLCALHEFRLPVDLVTWRGALIERVLLQLRMATTPNPPTRPPTPVSVVHTFEMLSRVAWNSPDVKEALASGGAIGKIMAILKQFGSSAGVQAAGCLALAGLVSGSGDPSLTNQWDIAKAMGVEAIASAMTTHLSEPMLQLAALMTFIPLAVGNPMMQASITQGALSQILTGLSTHRGIPPIQDKGMVLLGVLMQGDEPTLDAIRTCLLEAKIQTHIEAVLTQHAAQSDPILWHCLFCANLFSAEGKSKEVIRALARCPRLTRSMQEALLAHVARCSEVGMRGDELVLTTGDKLLRLLEAERASQQRAMLYWGATAAGLAATGLMLTRLWWISRENSSARLT